jgi:enediyne biosynthesis protein E4
MCRFRCSMIAAVLAAATLAAQEPAGSIRFRDVTNSAGLYEPLAGIMGHGGAWGDFDGDGLIDLFVGGFCDRPNAEYKPADGPVPSRLFRNLGGGKFELVKDTPASFFGRTSGAVFADLDNNGTLELYAANNAKPRTKHTLDPQRSAQTRFSNFFKNDAGKLIDISKESGVCPETIFTARNIGVFDYDGDGLLDLFIVEDMFTKKPRSVLFRNKGNLQFEDVTKAVGLPEDIFGLGLAVADLNEDGRPDIFVPHSNRLFLSDGGRYREVLSMKDMIAWKPASREDWPCGAAFGDLNRDGRLDLVIAIHCSTARNVVLVNDGLKDGVPQFRSVTVEAGLGDAIPVRCPHVEIQDFDNDGWPDIYISAAWMDDKGAVTPLIYRNTGIKPRDERSESRGSPVPRFTLPRPIDKSMVYYPAGPSGDFDNDGRLDLFLINWFQGNHSRLLHNDSPPRNGLQVEVVGKGKLNRMGIGAQVKLFAPGTKDLLGFQEISTGYGYASGQPAYAHFGLGKHKTVDVEIKLPDGRTLRREKIAQGQRLKVQTQ